MSAESNGTQMRHTYGFIFSATLAFGALANPARAADGANDGSWIAGGRELIPIVSGYDARLRDMLVQPDGKLVLAGDCDVPQAESLCIARLLPNGSLDLGFGPNATGRFTFEDYTDHYPPFGTLGGHGLLRQPDGRLLLAGHGDFNGPNNQTIVVGTLARLTADGQLEMTDGGSTYASFSFSDDWADPNQGDWAEAVALQPDGKIVIAGAGYRPGADPANRDFGVVRLNADRSMDTSFGSNGKKLIAFDQGGANDDFGEAVALQADGKIVIVGYAEIASGSSTAKNVAVARLNPDGSFDTGFGNSGRIWFRGYNAPDKHAIGYAVKIDRHGRIVIAGTAQFVVNGQDYDFLVARLLPDGSFDPAFAGGVSVISIDQAALLHDVAYDLALQSDGKILIAGSASRSASADSFAVARVTEEGEIDTSFGTSGVRVGTYAPASGFDDSATTMALGPGGIYIAGHGVSGTGAGLLDFGVARLKLDLIFADGFQ
jgi:uncharacterized delta-60 repeat protein